MFAVPDAARQPTSLVAAVVVVVIIVVVVVVALLFLESNSRLESHPKYTITDSRSHERVMSGSDGMDGNALANFIDDTDSDDFDDALSRKSSNDSDAVLPPPAGGGDTAAMAKAKKMFTPLRLLIVFTFVNVLNYVDRGIVSGAGTTIEGCNSTCTSPDNFCWDNITQKSCGKHFFREFCSELGETCCLLYTSDAADE